MQRIRLPHCWEAWRAPAAEEALRDLQDSLLAALICGTTFTATTAPPNTLHTLTADVTTAAGAGNQRASVYLYLLITQESLLEKPTWNAVVRESGKCSSRPSPQWDRTEYGVYYSPRQ